MLFLGRSIQCCLLTSEFEIVVEHLLYMSERNVGEHPALYFVDAAFPRHEKGPVLLRAGYLPKPASVPTSSGGRGVEESGST